MADDTAKASVDVEKVCFIAARRDRNTSRLMFWHKARMCGVTTPDFAVARLVEFSWLELDRPHFFLQKSAASPSMPPMTPPSGPPTAVPNRAPIPKRTPMGASFIQSGSEPNIDSSKVLPVRTSGRSG